MNTFTKNDMDIIKIQGFLYENRELIFKKDVIPEPATKYLEEDLPILTSVHELYKDLFENSIGILTSSHIELNDRKCIACQRCTRFCPSHALEKIGVDLILHKDKCIGCGNCIGNCPFLALKAPETGLGIYIKSSTYEMPYILPTLYKSTQLNEVLNKLNNFFNENKLSCESLYETVERIGFEKLVQSLN